MEGKSIPFPPATFGIVINIQVMEHVEDLDAALSKIHRVLKPGRTPLSLSPTRAFGMKDIVVCPSFAGSNTPRSAALYQNSQTLTHAACCPTPLQKRTVVQWDMGAVLKRGRCRG